MICHLIGEFKNRKYRYFDRNVIVLKKLTTIAIEEFINRLKKFNIAGLLSKIIDQNLMNKIIKLTTLKRATY